MGRFAYRLEPERHLRASRCAGLFPRSEHGRSGEGNSDNSVLPAHGTGPQPERIAGVRGADEGKADDSEWVTSGAQVLLDEGEQCLKSGQYEEAIGQFLQARDAATEKESSRVRYYLAYAYSLSGDTRTALKQAMGLQPSRADEWAPDFIILKATLLVDTNAYEQEIAWLIQSGNDLSGDAQRASIYYFLLGVGYHGIGDTSSEKQSLSKVVAISEQSALRKAATSASAESMRWGEKMNVSKRIVVWGAAAGVVALLWACSPNALLTDAQDKVQQAKSGVSVTGVSLNTTSLGLVVGGQGTLTATITPANATNQNVIWSSSATGVVTVSGGVVTAVAAGTATITVTTADGNKIATCAVTVVSSDKAITAFSIGSANGPMNGNINGTAIAVTVPYGTNVTALVATFATTGTSVKVGSTVQASGTTANNFASPVTYMVTAQDGSTQTYTVTVTVALNTAKAITAYSFVSVAATVTISGTSIAATVPYGTIVTALVANFTTTGTSVKVAGTAQVSGTTANNFTSPVTYTVAAADGSTQNYTVTVTVALNTAKAITAYSFVSVAATVTISGTSIAVTVPYGTNVTALVASFTTTGVSVSVGPTLQYSGVTANNFSIPVVYTVTAADGTTQPYTVTVTVALNTAKAITAYSFVSVAATVTISGTSIAATVPYGTIVTALVANFTTTGTSVKVAGTAQVSGTTANNFTSPVTYTVTAQDSSSQNYIVTVTVAPPSFTNYTTANG